MNKVKKNSYIGYEYKEVSIGRGSVPQYLDSYLNFGWITSDHQPLKEKENIVLRLRRDRKILNKAELTRLQQHFEDCMKQIEGLEKTKTSTATIVALTIGILGTAFMAGSTFAVVHEPPIIWLCILLAIPGFIGWITPYFTFRSLVRKKTERVNRLIEDKYNEIDIICEKGNRLLLAANEE